MDKLPPLAGILLGRTSPSAITEMMDVKFFDETLNESQEDAVRFSISAPDLALIHGPPGVTR